MERKLFIIFVIITLLVVGIFISRTSEAITIGFEPVTQDVALGQQASINLFIKDLGDYQSPSLGAFDIYVYYDPAILSFSNYSLGSYLGDISLGEALDISLLESFPGHFPGAINFAELSLLLPGELSTLQPSQFTFATITFDTLALGSSALHLWYNIGGLSDEWGNSLEAYLQQGSVNVVPESATIIYLLTGCGFAGIGYLRKNKFLIV